MSSFPERVSTRLRAQAGSRLRGSAATEHGAQRRLALRPPSTQAEWKSERSNPELGTSPRAHPPLALPSRPRPPLPHTAQPPNAHHLRLAPCTRALPQNRATILTWVLNPSGRQPREKQRRGRVRAVRRLLAHGAAEHHRASATPASKNAQPKPRKIQRNLKPRIRLPHSRPPVMRHKRPMRQNNPINVPL